MTGANLNLHEDDLNVKRRQRLAWIIMLAVIGVLLVIRGVVGSNVGPAGHEVTMHGFGTAYVRAEHRAFYESAPGVWKSAEGAVAGVAGGLASGVAPNPGAAQIAWTEYKKVTPAAFVAAEAESSTQTDLLFSWPRTLGIWAAAFFTLAVLSFLIRDNPAYKFTESVVIGVSAAYWMTTAFWDTLVPKLFHPLWSHGVQTYIMPSLPTPGAPPGFGWMKSVLGVEPATTALLLSLIPLSLGVLLLCRLNRKVSWLGMFPLAFIVGTFAGLKFVQFIESDLLAQIATMFNPLVNIVHVQGPEAAIDWAATVGSTVSSVLIFVGVLSVLVYFFFSLEHKGAVGRTARVGIWYLMITFGASFGFTVMGRIALLAARFEFLFDDWLWLVDPSNKH
ncbi:MAG: hypothetical protein JNK53_01330 [Phycisphaerae bacterium]|nr:hypothetical protein [Phycisphaerae bacterium]